MIKAVFIDVDGTLGIKNEESLSYNLKIINKMRKQGHKVFLNTGRTVVFLPEQIDYEKNFDGAVLGNGSHIIINGKTVFSEFMDKDFLLKSFEVCLKNNLQMSYEGDDNIIYRFDKDIWHENWIRIEDEAELKKYLETYKYRKITYKGVVDDCSEFEALSEKIKVEPMGMYDGKPVAAGEIIIKNTGKDMGIKRVSDVLGIKKEDTIAIGDSMNDYHMLEFAGIGVAVGNAEQKIKDIADIITDDCNKCGVGKALEKIFGGI